MDAVVVANGDVDTLDGRLLVEAPLLIAADGGSRAVLAAGRLPDVIAGDLDSLAATPHLAAAVEAGTVRLEERPAAKDETDTEVALAVAIAAGAKRVTVLGATGGERLDHELANLLLLADPDHRNLDLRLVAGATVVRAIHAGQRMKLDALPGDTVSLLPLGGDAVGVTTHGLAYRLDGDTLRFGRARGVSNVVVSRGASVELREGVLLVMEIGGAPHDGAKQEGAEPS